MSDAEILLQEVNVYLKPKDVEHIRQALEFSGSAHEGQLRQSGEPYISHPIAVARILTPLHLDAPAIIAALLHDVVEDTHISNKEVSEKFGKSVAALVGGAVARAGGEEAATRGADLALADAEAVVERVVEDRRDDLGQLLEAGPGDADLPAALDRLVLGQAAGRQRLRGATTSLPQPATGRQGEEQDGEREVDT